MTDRLPLQVASLTGQSDSGRCALSPSQMAFLKALELPEGAAVPWNFPYHPGPEHRPTPLWLASFRNASMYFASRRPAFREQHRGAVIELLMRAERTVFLAGSCGLELLANLDLPKADLKRCRLFAYGPVARKLPACPALLVQGGSDWLSRWYFPRVDHRIDAGHMDYLESPEVLRLCREFIG
jgi:hypothetical protein